MSHTAESLQAAFKYLWLAEVTALKALAQLLPDNPVVVNIGAGAGTSGLAFMESREDMHLYTIDIQEKSSPFGSIESEIQVLDEAGLFRNTVHIASDSKQVGKVWREWDHIDKYLVERWAGRNRLVDMVFIDGDHSYEGCKGDIEAWLPNIKPDGIIAIHDYKKSELYAHDKDYIDGAPHPKNWPGVDKAVDELLVGKYKQVLRIKSLIAFRA
jgi:predicted O-methyltransferase YrrM